jgi:hypothetical protein
LKLLPEFAGKVDLIYIDPPFDTGADFSFTATVPDDPESGDEELSTFTEEASIIEQKAYRDTWGVALNRICSGSIAPRHFSTNYFAKPGLSMFTPTGTLAFTPKRSSMRYSALIGS